MEKETVAGQLLYPGLVGAGWMGSNFARRMLKNGWPLRVYDIDEKRVDDLEGAIKVGSVDELLEQCDVILTSLPNSDVFERVMYEKIIDRAGESQIFVDLGTSRLGSSRAIAEKLKERGAALLDAPVSGDPRKPVYMFVGGNKDVFERARPLLEVISDPAHLTYGGQSGSGQILKGVNQLSMGLVGAAWLETVSFATRAGIDAGLVAKAVGGDSGWRLDLKRIAERVDRDEVKGMDLKFAELPYFLQDAELCNIEMPLTKALYDYCKDGPKDWRDNMNRPYVSFWHMLGHMER